MRSIVAGFALLSVLLVTQASAQPRADTRTWYQAYRDGVRQVQQRNWQSAIESLTTARNKGPKPGRRIPFYGDVFDDFLPEYYLGLAYVNTGRFKEAADVFDAVRATGLITAKDREFVEFTRQSDSASTELAKANQAAQAAAAKPPTATPTPATPPVTTQTQSPVTQTANASGTARAAVGAAEPTLGTGVPPKPEGLAASNVPAPRTPPATAVESNVPPRRVDPPRQNPPRTLPNRLDPAPATLGSESTAMAAFFGGDYQRAANLLSGLAVNGGTARAEFYLACSRAALVLTGGADPSTLADAQARFASIDAGQFAGDERFISPRILQVLRDPTP